MSGSNDTVSLRITLRYKHIDEFVERYADNLSAAGLFLRTRSPKPKGTKIRFELLLSNGTRALRGEGVVVSHRSDSKPGMALRFNSLDPESQKVIDKVVEAHGQGSLAPSPLEGGFADAEGKSSGWGTGEVGTGSILSRRPGRRFGQITGDLPNAGAAAAPGLKRRTGRAWGSKPPVRSRDLPRSAPPVAPSPSEPKTKAKDSASADDGEPYHPAPSGEYSAALDSPGPDVFPPEALPELSDAPSAAQAQDIEASTEAQPLAAPQASEDFEIPAPVPSEDPSSDNSEAQAPEAQPLAAPQASEDLPSEDPASDNSEAQAPEAQPSEAPPPEEEAAPEDPEPAEAAEQIAPEGVPDAQLPEAAAEVAAPSITAETEPALSEDLSPSGGVEAPSIAPPGPESAQQAGSEDLSAAGAPEGFASDPALSAEPPAGLTSEDLAPPAALESLAPDLGSDTTETQLPEPASGALEAAAPTLEAELPAEAATPTIEASLPARGDTQIEAPPQHPADTAPATAPNPPLAEALPEAADEASPSALLGDAPEEDAGPTADLPPPSASEPLSSEQAALHPSADLPEQAGLQDEAPSETPANKPAALDPSMEALAWPPPDLSTTKKRRARDPFGLGEAYTEPAASKPPPAELARDPFVDSLPPAPEFSLSEDSTQTSAEDALSPPAEAELADTPDLTPNDTPAEEAAAENHETDPAAEDSAEGAEVEAKELTEDASRTGTEDAEATAPPAASEEAEAATAEDAEAPAEDAETAPTEEAEAVPVVETEATLAEDAEAPAEDAEAAPAEDAEAPVVEAEAAPAEDAEAPAEDAEAAPAEDAEAPVVEAEAAPAEEAEPEAPAPTEAEEADADEPTAEAEDAPAGRAAPDRAATEVMSQAPGERPPSESKFPTRDVSRSTMEQIAALAVPLPAPRAATARDTDEPVDPPARASYEEDDVTREVGALRPDEPAPVLGIDIGGRWSRVGFVRQGGLQLLAQEGQIFQAALVAARDDGSLAIGVEALEIGAQSPERVAAPRDLLRAIEDAEQVHDPRLQVAEHGIQLKLGAFSFDLVDVLFTYFHDLRKRIAAQLGPREFTAMISLPAGASREAARLLKNACREAKLTLVGVVDETEAASRAYDLPGRKIDRALLIDLGATHLAVSALQRDERGYKMLGHSWRQDLSAASLDQAIAALAAKEAGLSGATPLLPAAPSARIDVRGSAQVDLTSPEGSVRLSRRQIYGATEQLVADVCRQARRVLDEAQIPPQSLNAVLLAGTGGNYPPLEEALRSLTQCELLHSVAPTQVYAHGLATSGLARKQRAAASEPDALSDAVGIGLPGGRFLALFAAGTKLPAKLDRPFNTTRDQQTELELRLYQGSQPQVRANKMLGALTLRGIPKKPRGEVRIRLRMDIALDGVLTVELFEPSSGAMNALKIATAQTPPERKAALVNEQPRARETKKPRSGFFSRLFGR